MTKTLKDVFDGSVFRRITNFTFYVLTAGRYVIRKTSGNFLSLL